MRFPRQAKIFRGHLDAAPVAGVLLLLLIFLQLHSLLYTPGVLVRLDSSDPLTARTVRVTRAGEFVFGTNSYNAGELEQLRAAMKRAGEGASFELRVDAGAPPSQVDQIRARVGDLLQIELPTGWNRNLSGTDDPKIVVAVNFLGQYFYTNRIMGERELTNQLRSAARQWKDLTLVEWADKQADIGAVNRLEQWASEAGIKQAVRVVRPEKGGK